MDDIDPDLVDYEVALPDLDVNLGPLERGVSVTLGLAAIAFAVSEKKPQAAVLGIVGAYLGFRGLTGHCPLYEALDLGGDDEAEDDRLREGRHEDASVEVAVTIARPVDEVYAFWRRLENLPQFMQHLLSVTEEDDTRSRWTAEVPGVGAVEWEAEILEDRPGELIAWRSLPGSEVHHEGAVRFRPAPGGRGTEIRLSMEPFSRGGRLSRKLARLVGWGTEKYVEADVRRLKQILEAGEAPTTAGQPSGRDAAAGHESA